jgi:hypothetical protein
MSRYGPAGGYPDEPRDPRRGRQDDPYHGQRAGQPSGGWEPHHGGWEGQEGQQGWETQRGWETQPGREGQPGWGDPYGQPADPWGQGQDSWSDLTQPQPAYQDPQQTRAYPPPVHHRPPYPPDPRGEPDWDEPAPPRRRTGLLVALVLVLVLVVAAGIGAVLFWTSGDGSDPGAGGVESPSAPATGEAADEDENGVPQDRIGMGAVVAQEDDCLVNESTDDDPVMRIVPCDTDEDTRVYRVLSRADQQVSGETAEEQDSSAHQICGEVGGYQYHYRFVGQTEDDSFVLCMSEE